MRQSKGFIILNPTAGGGNPEKVEEILNSIINESEHIRFFTAKEEIRLEAEKQLPIHGDGEMLEVDLPVTAVVVPKASLHLFNSYSE